MKKIIYAVLGIALLAACGSKPEGELEELVSKRDSLRNARVEIEAQIMELEAKIAEIDSTIERKLVTVYNAEVDTFKHYFDVYGNVQSDKSATIFAENPGTVQSILVQEGEKVQKGQVIVRLDAGLYDKNIQELQTSLDLATTLFEKQKRLWEQNVGSELQYLEAKNRKESLESSLATLREQKSKSTVVAPFTGVVDKIFPKVGEMAGMQTPIARVINLDELYITAEVSERYVNDLSEGDDVVVVINRRDTIQSKISRIGKYINPTNRSFEIRVSLSDDTGKLRPNSLVALKINDYTDPEALVVPASIIMQDGKGKDYIFVVGKDDKGDAIAKKQPVETGMSYLGKTVIENGLEPELPIIDKGSRSVRDGDPVNITSI